MNSKAFVRAIRQTLPFAGVKANMLINAPDVRLTGSSSLEDLNRPDYHNRLAPKTATPPALQEDDSVTGEGVCIDVEASTVINRAVGRSIEGQAANTYVSAVYCGVSVVPGDFDRLIKGIRLITSALYRDIV